MATFTNTASLRYADRLINSNTVTGELLEVLSGTKTAVSGSYAPGDAVTYVISLRNTGSTALTNLSIVDDLGAYSLNGDTLYPLDYVEGSLQYYVNGLQQPAPAVTAGPPLSLTGLSLPANSSATLLYQARVNAFAPLDVEASITNSASVTGGGLSSPLLLSSTINSESGAELSIAKALCPPTVTENGQLSYTFIIQNSGNTPIVTTDAVVLTDSFEPILDPISVSFNGEVWSSPADYTYDPETGLFTTQPGAITVPAATYTQNPDGSYTLSPGVSTLVVTGTV